MSLGLADPILHDHESSKSIIYNTSCTWFFKPVLTPADDDEEIITRRKVRVKDAFECIMRCQSYYGCNFNNQVAHWDTQFETGAKTALLQPFSPVVVAADDTEYIRVWNYEETTLLNSFNNHEYPNKGISKLLLLNELDDSLLLVASSDGNVRVWKDYTTMSKQKLVTAFSSIQGGKGANVVVDWQQQSGYFYASGGISSTMIWDMNKEQILSSIPLASDCSISALAASQVHGDLYAAGFMDGSVRLFDIRTPEGPVCVARPHAPTVERVVGVGFQPGLYPAKILSASEAGGIKFLDMRNQSGPYMAIDAHHGSLTTLAIHRHAPLVANGSAASQLIKVFNIEGERLTTIRQSPNFMARKVGPTSSLAFHPYQILLAAGSTDASVSIYADEASGPSFIVWCLSEQTGRAGLGRAWFKPPFYHLAI